MTLREFMADQVTTRSASAETRRCIDCANFNADFDGGGGEWTGPGSGAEINCMRGHFYAQGQSLGDRFNLRKVIHLAVHCPDYRWEPLP